MNCCISVKNCDQRNENIRKIVRILKVLGYLQIFVCLYAFIVSLVSGIILGFACIVLFFVLTMKTWEACVFYILVCLTEFYYSLLFVMHVVINCLVIGGNIRLMFVIYLTKFPFSLLCGFYCFLLYKELKAETIEDASTVIVVTNYGVNENRSESNQNFDAFNGTSYRI